MSLESAVLVGCSDNSVWSRVKGRGTFQNSGGLRRFNQEMMTRGFRIFIVDLGDCEVMDSTFMGTLAGLALQLREKSAGSLQVIRANERNASLLKNLGLDQLFTVLPVGDPATPEIPREAELATSPCQQPSTEVKKNVLEAHEALVEADSRNAIKFQDVLEYLAEESRTGNSNS